ncbi:hypothetical protein [Kitasatospora sp. P5_F3]
MTRTAFVLLATAVAVLFALLVAVGAGVLARLDGRGYPAAVVLAGAAFAGTLTLAAVLTACLVTLLRG